VVTVLAVRHADIVLPRTSTDPELAPAGRERAVALARLVGEAGVSAIFTSEFRRTRQTVEPLAERIGVAPQLTPPPSPWANQARAGQFGSVLLVAGHSDTVPAMLGALGVAPRPVISDTEFDNLFVLTTQPGHSPALLRLRYGAAG